MVALGWSAMSTTGKLWNHRVFRIGSETNRKNDHVIVDLACYWVYVLDCFGVPSREDMTQQLASLALAKGP